MKRDYIFRSKLRNRTPSRALVLGLAASIVVAPAAVAQSVPDTSAHSSINLDLGSMLATGIAANEAPG